MSLIAIAEGQRTLATPDGPRRGTCPGCRGEMLAKTGSVNIHHWAHLHIEGEDPCQHEPETLWHLQWKLTCTERDRIEVATQDGKRRADVMTPYGWAVEFQHSPLDVREVRARERDHHRRMVWVYDCLAPFEADRLRVHRSPDAPQGRHKWNLRWAHAREFVIHSTVPVFLHYRPDDLVYVGRWYKDSTPRYGFGWKLDHDEFVDTVVNGTHTPRHPQFGQPLDPRDLWSEHPGPLEQSGPEFVDKRDLDLARKHAEAAAFHAAAAAEGRRSIEDHLAAVDLVRGALGGEVVETTLPITRTRKVDS